MNVLENVISKLLTHFTQVIAIPTAADFIVFCTCNLFLVIYSIIYSNYFNNFAVWKNAVDNLIKKMVWPKLSQYVVNRYSSPCTPMASIFVDFKWSVSSVRCCRICS